MYISKKNSSCFLMQELLGWVYLPDNTRCAIILHARGKGGTG